MTRPWLLFISAIIFIVSAQPFVMGADLLSYGLSQKPYIPVGNIIAATGILALLIFGHVASDALYSPEDKLQSRLATISKVMIFCGIAWWPIGYILADNFAGNFGTTDGFRGSVLAGNVYRAYTCGIIILSSILWLISLYIRFFGRNKTE